MLRVGLLLALISCGKVVSVVDAGDPDGSGSDAALCATMNCDDSDPCTMDSCAANTCVHSVMVVHGQQMFGATGAIQPFTPNSCVRVITIEATGAQGGSSMANGQPGGFGAHIKGDFIIADGVVLSVLVGSPGGSAVNVGGGGGGSFVWNPASPAQPYLVAGGGGGAGLNSAGQLGLTTQNGGNGVATLSGGGTNGSGGVAPTPVTNWAAGGAGWVSNGADGGGAMTTSQACSLATGGKAPKNGGLGGAAGGNAGNTGPGGFGGGGGAQGQCNATGGGGGGGYGGGGGGIDNSPPNFTGGGGGGSFNAGANATSMPSTNAGAGSVTITW